MQRNWHATVITVSDSPERRDAQDDASGDLIVERLGTLPAEIVCRQGVPDDVEEIRSAVSEAIGRSDLVILTGGTGLGPRDVTPQAILPLLDYQVPGIEEAMRRDGLLSTPYAMLSRQVVGVIKGRLVIALPGSPRAVGECLNSIWPALPHALCLLVGDTSPHERRADARVEPGNDHPPM
jgi:molybdenum cofactor synthesis domain-containing protein